MLDNLCLLDKEYESVRDTYSAKVDTIEADLQSYINHTKSVISEGVLGGRSADALLDFIELVEQSIKDELSDILFRHKVITGQFVDNLAEADDAEL